MNAPILLVDDNADLLKITQIILKAQGFDSEATTTIEQAETIIQQRPPAVLLLDCSICEQNDGRVFCNRLKEDARTNGIRIILMSGNEYSSAEWSGADDFLPKPFEYTELLDKINQQLATIQQPAVS
jgi:two-component system, OmpR family, response regulator VicR